MTAANWHFSANMCPRNSSHKIFNQTEFILTKKIPIFLWQNPQIKQMKTESLGSELSFCKVSYVGAYIHIHPQIEQKQQLGKNQMKLWPGDNDNDNGIDYDNLTM